VVAKAFRGASCTSSRRPAHRSYQKRRDEVTHCMHTAVQLRSGAPPSLLLLWSCAGGSGACLLYLFPVEHAHRLEARVDGRGLPLVVDDMHRAHAAAALAARPPDRLSAESRAIASSEPHSSPTRRPAGGARGRATQTQLQPQLAGSARERWLSRCPQWRRRRGRRGGCWWARAPGRGPAIGLLPGEWWQDYRHGMQLGGGRKRWQGRRRCAALHAAPQNRIAG